MTPSQMSLGILTSNFNLLLLLDEAADAPCEDEPYGDLLLRVGGNLKKYLYTKFFWNRVSPFFMFLEISRFSLKSQFTAKTLIVILYSWATMEDFNIS